MFTYTWIRPRERQPRVITVKFLVNQTGTLAGRSGVCLVGVKPWLQFPPVLQPCPCESKESCKNWILQVSNCSQRPYCTLRRHTDNTHSVFFPVSLSELTRECRPRMQIPLSCVFSMVSPHHQVLISYKSSSISESTISVEQKKNMYFLDYSHMLWVVDLLLCCTVRLMLLLILKNGIWFTCSRSDSRGSAGVILSVWSQNDLTAAH